MTVPNETARTRYAGNGATVLFSTVFAFQTNDQVRVIHVDSAGAETEWTENTQYTLTGADTGAAGEVTVISAPTDYTPAADEFLVVMLDVEGVQSMDGNALGEVDAEQLEALFDNHQLQLNQLREQISRATLSSEGSEPGSTDAITAWSPVLAVVDDGSRRVFQVVDWSGGDGDKPDTGAYIGPTGLVAAVGDGSDVRGAAGANGAGSGDMLAAQNLNDLANKATGFANIKQAATTSATGVSELCTDAEAQAKTDTARVLTASNLAALAASATFAGLVELATSSEAVTGTDTARAVTPAGVAAAIAAAGNIPAGSAMLFAQTSAPSGWTKSTTHNDKALRVVSGSASSGGSVNFSTLFARTGTDAVTLITANLPAHTHTYSKWSNSSATIDGGVGNGNVYGGVDTEGAGETSGSTGSGTSFTPAIDCRVKYVDVIIATKD
jgi:hypothetical protein